MRKTLSSAKSVPEIMKGMLEFSHLLWANETDKVLAELVKTRASQINIWSCCSPLYTTENGEREEPLHMLAGWGHAHPACACRLRPLNSNRSTSRSIALAR